LQAINEIAILKNDYPCIVLNEVIVDTVNQLKAFVATAQTSSFTSAADHLGISNRLTSKYVAALEDRLGTRLFQRTTRKVGLTPAGEDLLTRAPALLDDLDELLTEVTEGSHGFSGVVRISAPVTFGEVYVVGMLERFSRKNPELNIDLRLSDRFEDLATEGIDLAFRLGSLDTLSLKARKLGEFPVIIAASPDYLTKFGTPSTPDDLSNHNCILDSNRKGPRLWAFKVNGEQKIINVFGRFQVNSASAAVDLAIGGTGLVYAPYFAIYKALNNGTLVPVLQDYQGVTSPLNAVYLEGRVLPRKIRALIDFAITDIKTAGVL